MRSLTHLPSRDIASVERNSRASIRPGERVQSLADDAYIEDLAKAVAGNLGGKVGVAPRVFLKKLVADILDRIDQFPDFDPRRDYQITVSLQELTRAEREARSGVVGPAESPDDVELEL